MVNPFAIDAPLERLTSANSSDDSDASLEPPHSGRSRRKGSKSSKRRPGPSLEPPPIPEAPDCPELPPEAPTVTSTRRVWRGPALARPARPEAPELPTDVESGILS